MWIEHVHRWVAIQRCVADEAATRSLATCAGEAEARARAAELVAGAEREGFTIAEPRTQPRFVLANADGSEAVSLQLRGELLLEATGPLAELASTAATP